MAVITAFIGVIGSGKDHRAITLRINSEADAAGAPIIPKAQERPRLGRWGRVRSPKTPWYHLVRWRATQEAPARPLDGPVGLCVTFIFPRPQTYPKRQVLKWTKPDIDNLIKGTMDALTAARWWADDGRVCDLRTVKRYAAAGEAPGAIIEAWQMEDPAWPSSTTKRSRAGGA